MGEKHEWNANGHRHDVVRDEHKDGDYALATSARHHAFTRALKHQQLPIKRHSVVLCIT